MPILGRVWVHSGVCMSGASPPAPPGELGVAAVDPTQGVAGGDVHAGPEDPGSGAASHQGGGGQMSGSRLLLDPRAPDAPRWAAVDDVVMGGRSASRMEATPQGDALFHGFVSLDGGGFASVRTEVEWPDLSAQSGLILTVLGDGRRYRLRLWTQRGMNQVAYQCGFHPPEGQWATVSLPFHAFTPSFRGRSVPGAPPLDPTGIRQVGIMMGDGQEGPFRLELRSIEAAFHP